MPNSVWGVVANVAAPGTKHFSEGTKVYVLFPLWSGERVRVFGKHRNSRLIELVMDKKHLTNWRVKEIYSPIIMNELTECYGHSEWTKEKAEAFVDGVNNVT